MTVRNGRREPPEQVQAQHVDDQSKLATFNQYRALLFSIAYRMLGTISDAEDMVQDAFIRWHGTPDADIESPKAFLITIVSRLCINQLESARVRREVYVGEWLPEPIVTDPAGGATGVLQIDESVSMALLLLLERLTPPERAVFLLQEIFEYTHAEIAAMLDLSENNCRQLLRRARQHIHTARPRANSSADAHINLLEQFRRAAGAGDVDGLVALLSTDVVFHTDGGGKAPALPVPVFGRDKVARALLQGYKRAISLNVVQHITHINGTPGIVSYLNGRPQSVFIVEGNEGRIDAIYVVTNPEKLSHLPPSPS